MRRLLLGVSAVTALCMMMATPAAHAARVDTGAVWVAPSHLQSLDLRYGAYTGTIDAYRTGAGTGSANMCLLLSQQTRQRDGSTRFDIISGCQSEALHSAYAFDPLRWKGALSVSVPLERHWFVDHVDGTIESSPLTAIGAGRVELRWAGFDNAELRPYIGTSYSGLHPIYVGVAATKHAWVNGTIGIGRDTVPVTRVAGTMQNGGEI
jgi:hypothetical protein